MAPEAEGARGSPAARIDHFELIRTLGRGGMAEVFLARDTALGRLVALKLILPESLASDDVERFLREARMTACFNHPHIVTLFAAGTANGRPYVVLEFVDGETLRARLARRPGLREALRYTLAIAEALVEAHGRGILHRDLKPENVMIGRDGRLRVLDFGLARRIGTTQGAGPDALAPPSPGQHAPLEATFASARGELCGTPQYMAPEQWERSATGPATDVWALGVILYELLSGTRPFVAEDSFELALLVCGDRRAPPLDAPAEIAALAAACLDKDPERRPTATQVAATLRGALERESKAPDEEGPFRGLLPFDHRHAHLFFGRTTEIESFVERLRAEPLLLVIGASGVGKSSFVRAGVVPRLEEQAAWTVLTLRPGPEPFRSLAAALGGADALADELEARPERLGVLLAERSNRVLLFVDQLEEVVTLVEPTARREAFMRALVAAAPDPSTQLRVVCTLREEFLSRLTEDAVTRRGLRAIEVLGSPGPESLREALVRPLARAGYHFEPPEVPDEMVAELEGETACLPLLQFAAQQLWELRDRERRCVLGSSLKAMGGVAGTLARHADGVLAAMTAAEVELARSLLLRLVTPEGTRRVLSTSAAVDGLAAGADETLRRLVAARLVNARQVGTPEAEVELAHESLTVAWARLRRWLEASREELVILDQLSQAAGLWESRGCPPEETWAGESLLDAERSLERCTTEVPSAVKRFLTAGHARHARQRRTMRALRVGSAAALIVITVAATFAAVLLAARGREAREQQLRAEHGRAAALLEGARAAYEAGDPRIARARLRASLELRDSGAGRALFATLAAEPLRWRRPFGGALCKLAFSADSARLAAACTDHALYLFDAETAEYAVLRGNRERANGVAFSAKGDRVATAGMDGEVRVWSTETLELLGQHAAHAEPPQWVGFDGERVLSLSSDSVVTWREGEPERRRQLPELGGLGAATLSPRDGLLFGAGTRVFTVEAEGARPLLELGGERVITALDARAGRLLVGRSNGAFELWDLEGHERIRGWRPHQAALRSAHLVGETTAITSAADRRVVRTDLATGRHEVIHEGVHTFGSVAATETRVALVSPAALEVYALDLPPRTPPAHGHAHPGYGVLFLPGGEQLVTSANDGTLIVWDAASGQPIHHLDAHTDWVPTIALTPDGRHLLSASTDRTLRMWSVADWSQRVIHEGTSPLYGVAASPTGLVAWTTQNGELGTLDLASGRTRLTPKHDAVAMGLAFLPDGRILTGGHDGWVHLSDPRTLETIASMPSEDRAMSFASHGDTIAVSAWTKLWLWRPGTERVLLDTGARTGAAIFHPDGRLVITGADGRTRVWRLGADTFERSFEQPDEANHPALDARGERLATTGDDRHVRLWELDSGRPLWRGAWLEPGPPRLWSHRGVVALDGAVVSSPPDAAWARALLERAVLAARAEDGSSICWIDASGRVERWALGEDQALAAPKRRATALVATKTGCWFHDGTTVFDEQDATIARASVLSEDGGLLLVDGERVLRFDGGGEVSAPGRPSAIAQIEGALFVGFRDGNLARPSGGPTFERSGPGAVVRIIEGPAGTLIAGQADGTVGIWERSSGALLDTFRIHGIPRHLHVEGGKLYAASELGAAHVLDLGHLLAERCVILEQVGRAIPIIWDGHVERAPAPPRCDAEEGPRAERSPAGADAESGLRAGRGPGSIDAR